MKAKQLIDGASYGPDALYAIGRAFDAAWTEIAGNFGNDRDEIEAARLRLARAMLSIADEDSRDVAVLKKAALERMALDYRLRSEVRWSRSGGLVIWAIAPISPRSVCWRTRSVGMSRVDPPLVLVPKLVQRQLETRGEGFR